MGRTMDVEAALAEAQEKIAARRREKEATRAMQKRRYMIESDVVGEEPDPYMDPEAYPTSQQEESSDQYKAMKNIGFALDMMGPETYLKDISGRRSKGGDMAALKTALESDWDLSEAASKAEFDRALLLTGRNPDAYKMHKRGMSDIAARIASDDTYRDLRAADRDLRAAEPRSTRPIGRPSAGRSAVLGEYRADPAWEAGFQSVLMNRDSYSLADLDGSGLRADGARDGVLVSRGDTDSLNDLGRSEALEFLEREAKKVERQSLIEGMQ